MTTSSTPELQKNPIRIASVHAIILPKTVTQIKRNVPSLFKVVSSHQQRSQINENLLNKKQIALNKNSKRIESTLLGDILLNPYSNGNIEDTYAKDKNVSQQNYQSNLNSSTSRKNDETLLPSTKTNAIFDLEQWNNSSLHSMNHDEKHISQNDSTISAIEISSTNQSNFQDLSFQQESLFQVPSNNHRYGQSPYNLLFSYDSLDEITTAQMKIQLNSTQFSTIHSADIFSQKFDFRRVIQEAWAGKNVSFIFHGGPEDVRRQNVTFSGLDLSKSFILKVSECLLKQLQLKTDKFSTSRYKIEISMMELYKNKVLDMLFPMNPENFSKPSGLSILTHPKYGPYCPTCANFRVRSMLEIKKLLELGLRERSSRKIFASENQASLLSTDSDIQELLSSQPSSHFIFQIVLTQTTFDFSKASPATEIISKITIADLAGNIIAPSEASPVSTFSNETWLNQSNHVLSSLIQKLFNNSKAAEKSSSPTQEFIPYRDSNLTLLLKDSLGGNCQTEFFICISPTIEELKQTKSSLEFATVCSSIKNRPQINRYKNDSIVAECEEHIFHLTHQIQSTLIQDDKYLQLKSELEQEKDLLSIIKKSPKDRIQYMLQKRKSNISEMLQNGISIHSIGDLLEYDISILPYLFSLKPGLSQFERFVYFLTESTITIGSQEDNSIVIKEKGITGHHCVISREVDEYDEEKIIIDRIDSNSQIYVNGEVLEFSTILNSGDRLVLGEEIFQFTHPKHPTISFDEWFLEQELLLKSKNLDSYDNAGLSLSSISAWESAKKEIIEKRSQLLDQEIKNKENKISLLLREAQEKEAKKNELSDHVTHAQVTLESMENIITNRSETTVQIEAKMRKYQKYLSDVKAQDNALRKEISENEEKLSQLDSQVRNLRSEIRYLEENKVILNQELVILNQEKKVALELKEEYKKEKDLYDDQMQKSKELDLKISEKSLHYNQKKLEIQELKIKLKHKEIELQKKINEVHNLEVTMEENNDKFQNLLDSYDKKKAELETIEDQLEKISIKYEKMKKRRKACLCPCFICCIYNPLNICKKKKSSNVKPIEVQIVPNSQEKKSNETIFKSEIKRDK